MAINASALADFQSQAGQDMGVSAMQLITGQGGLGQQLQQDLQDQEDERKKKLTGLDGSSTLSLAAQALLGNQTGGFGG